MFSHDARGFYRQSAALARPALGLQVQAPDISGYRFEDRSTAGDVHFYFSRELPDGRGDAAVFAQLYRPGYIYIDNLDLRAQAAVRELKDLFADLSYTM